MINQMSIELNIEEYKKKIDKMSIKELKKKMKEEKENFEKLKKKMKEKREQLKIKYKEEIFDLEMNFKKRKIF